MEPVFGQRRQKGTKMECAIFVPELFIDSYCSRKGIGDVEGSNTDIIFYC